MNNFFTRYEKVRGEILNISIEDIKTHLFKIGKLMRIIRLYRPLIYTKSS